VRAWRNGWWLSVAALVVLALDLALTTVQPFGQEPGATVQFLVAVVALLAVPTGLLRSSWPRQRQRRVLVPATMLVPIGAVILFGGGLGPNVFWPYGHAPGWAVLLAFVLAAVGAGAAVAALVATEASAPNGHGA
jgi:hypothetical protein